jgi:hypothetical protein
MGIADNGAAMPLAGDIVEPSHAVAFVGEEMQVVISYIAVHSSRSRPIESEFFFPGSRISGLARYPHPRGILFIVMAAIDRQIAPIGALPQGRYIMVIARVIGRKLRQEKQGAVTGFKINAACHDVAVNWPSADAHVVLNGVKYDFPGCSIDDDPLVLIPAPSAVFLKENKVSGNPVLGLREKRQVDAGYHDCRQSEIIKCFHGCSLRK